MTSPPRPGSHRRARFLEKWGTIGGLAVIAVLMVGGGLYLEMKLAAVRAGVETEAQRSRARKPGRDTVRGFLYDRPMDADDVLDRFASAETAGPCRGHPGS